MSWQAYASCPCCVTHTVWFVLVERALILLNAAVVWAEKFKHDDGQPIGGAGAAGLIGVGLTFALGLIVGGVLVLGGVVVLYDPDVKRKQKR